MATNYPLHKAVFRHDVAEVERLIASYPPALLTDGMSEAVKHPLNEKDHRGNTALHIAVLQGYDDIARLLLAANVNTRVQNAGRWTPTQECVSISNRELLTDMYRHLQRTMREKYKQRAPELMDSLRKAPDFYGEIFWKFSSWLPIVSRFCPSDTFRIWKRGTDVRVDVSLVDFERFSWKRGHISFIFKADPDPNKRNKMYIVNRMKKTIKTLTKDVVSKKHSEADDVELLLQHEVVRNLFDSEAVEFGPKRTWLGYDKEEVIEKWNTKIYEIKNMQFSMLTRTDHFTPELEERRRRQKQKGDDKWKDAKEWAENNPEEEYNSDDDEEYSDLSSSEEEEEESDNDENKQDNSASGTEASDDEEEEDETNKIEPYDFPKYTPPHISFDDYFRGSSDDGLRIGPEPKVQTSTKNFKASVWLSQDFPVDVDDILPILEIIAPANPHAAKLKQFIELKMPPGFPVQVEIPIFHVLFGTATFQNFELRTVSSKVFDLPHSHKHVKFKSRVKKHWKAERDADGTRSRSTSPVGLDGVTPKSDADANGTRPKSTSNSRSKHSKPSKNSSRRNKELSPELSQSSQNSMSSASGQSKKGSKMSRLSEKLANGKKSVVNKVNKKIRKKSANTPDSSENAPLR